MDCLPFSDPLVVACATPNVTEYALVFPAVQYLCTKETPTSPCISTGKMKEWNNYAVPTSTSRNTCNGESNGPAPVLKIRSTADCGPISHTAADWALPTTFSAPEPLGVNAAEGCAGAPSSVPCSGSATDSTSGAAVIAPLPSAALLSLVGAVAVYAVLP